jgi:hypothetical protein
MLFSEKNHVKALCFQEVESPYLCGSSHVRSRRRRLHLRQQGVYLGSWLPKGDQEGIAGSKATDFSVVLLRSDCRLVSEGHLMKTPKNQCFASLLSPTDIACGATNQGTHPRGWGAGAFTVT